MKTRITIALSVVFILTLFSASLLAQEKEKEEAPKYQLQAVVDEVVPPSKVMEYEAGMKAWKDLNTKYKFPVPITVYKTNDNHYYVLMPIKKLGDLDKLEKFWAEVKEKAGKEFEEEEAKLLKQFAGNYESATFGVVSHRLDLSYIPENPRVKTEDVNFVWWNYYYIKTENQGDIEKISKEWLDLYKKHGITNSYNVYQPMIWSDMPVVVAAGGALSASDYFIHSEKDIMKMGDEFLALNKKTMDKCRRFEQKYGMLMKELSFIPEMK
jgi:hypothetical protein